MSNTPRHGLADLLRSTTAGGSFSTCRTAPAGDLLITCRGVGPLRLPVTAAQAKAMRLVSRPARYGKGTETLLDRRVRDTWEVPRTRISIDQRRWANTLGPMLKAIGGDLGLAATATLQADLHSVLVYEPGQYFAAHQDSEKDDQMVGSLVVLLPSRSTGGDLVVSHRGQTEIYRGSRTALTFIAFYSDTRHEVLPVTSGNRVALTYNLRLRGDATAGTGAAQRSTAAADLLRQHFATPAASRWGLDSAAGNPPDRLVFLLDHQYSEHSLRWPQLKGDDAARAVMLRTAAADADCETTLALAEVHETWDVQYDDYRRGGRRWSSWHDEGPGADDVDALGDVIDSDVEIRAAEGRVVGASRVTDAELAMVTPSVELQPYDTEYTGNMGNYGNTMDRWYRRAAVVIWPRSRAFSLRATGDPASAVEELLAMGGGEPAMIGVLLRTWPGSVRSGDQRTLLPGAVLLAAAVDDAELAAGLLAPFAVEAVSPTDAGGLLAVANRHGQTWFAHLLAGWMAGRAVGYRHDLPQRAVWAASVDDLCVGLLHGDASSSVRSGAASTLTAAIWAWLRRAIETSRVTTPPSARRAALASLGAPLLAVLNAARLSSAPDVCAEIVDVVCAPTPDAPVLVLATIAASSRLAPQELAGIDLEPLARYAADALRAELATPERRVDDWAIAGFTPGGCCHCTQLAAFLTDADRTKHVWPLAKPRRDHIHRCIDDAELPVTHTTIRQGSPHKLVLTKTADVFRREAARRAAAATELAEVERFLTTTPRLPPRRTSRRPPRLSPGG